MKKWVSSNLEHYIGTNNTNLHYTPECINNTNIHCTLEDINTALILQIL